MLDRLQTPRPVRPPGHIGQTGMFRLLPILVVNTSDGEAGKHFDRRNTMEVGEARNVRVVLATDGFNPYGMTAAPSNCRPVFVIPLNLPPGVIFQRQNIFLSLIIPGYPGG